MEIAERIQILGGVSIAMGADAALLTRIAKPRRGREAPPAQISRSLEAHQVIITEARELGKVVEQLGDNGSNDLLISKILRTSELQAWFLYEHLVRVPLVGAHASEEQLSQSGQEQQDLENEYYDSSATKNIPSLNKSPSH